jgi:hypothetical protein
MTLTDQLLAVFQHLGHTLVDSVPRVLAGLAIVVVMLAVAKLLERLLRRMLRRIHFDALFAQFGLDRTLARIGVTQAPSWLVPRVIYLLLLILFAQTAADLLGLSAVSRGIAAFFDYLPNLVAALLLVFVASLASQAAARIVARAAEQSGIEFASSLGSLVGGLVFFVIGIMAISQLRIDTEMVRIVTICTLSGLSLAFGLSFGLGTREITRNIIAGFYARKIFRAGEEMEVRGQRGVLKAITPTQTLLDQDGRTVAIANSAFLDEVVRQ